MKLEWKDIDWKDTGFALLRLLTLTLCALYLLCGCTEESVACGVLFAIILGVEFALEKLQDGLNLAWMLALVPTLVLCLPGGVRAQAPRPSQYREDPYKWEEVPGKPGWHALYKDGRQIGAYDTSKSEYFSWNGIEFKKTECPYPWTPQARPIKKNFGVDEDKLQIPEGDVEHFHLDGKDATRKEIMQVMANLQDDSKKNRLLIIGPRALRDQVLSDIKTHPGLSEITRGVIVQDYEPSHYHVADRGYITTGSPTIYLLSPDGTILHMQEDYQGGASALNEALRRRPDKTPRGPDLRKPLDRFRPKIELPWSAYALVGAGALVLLWPKKEKA